MWCSPEDVRKIVGISPRELPDSRALSWIEQGQSIVRHDTALKLELVQLEGAIDGKNKLFKVPLAPIGDSDFDAKVTPSDIEVLAYTDSEKESTRTKVDVNRVWPIAGQIELKSAPSTDIQAIKANYWHSWIIEDSNALKLATSLMAGYLYAVSEYALMPVRQRMGSLDIQYSLTSGRLEGLYSRLYSEYQRVIMPFRRKLHESLKVPYMELETPLRIGVEDDG